MAISFQTKITSLHTSDNPQKGTVTTVHGYIYGIDSSDAGFNTTAKYIQDLPTPEEGGSFVPYENLTEAQVASWVESTMDPEARKALEDRITSSIQFMINGGKEEDRPNDPALPWPVPAPTPIS